MVHVAECQLGLMSCRW